MPGKTTVLVTQPAYLRQYNMAVEVAIGDFIAFALVVFVVLYLLRMFFSLFTDTER